MAFRSCFCKDTCKNLDGCSINLSADEGERGKMTGGTAREEEGEVPPNSTERAEREKED